MKTLLSILFVFLPFIGHLQIDEDVFLIARNTGEKIVANGDTIRTMGFAESLSENPGVPGPTLEFFEGDSIQIDLWNVSQGAPHTIHLHGLDVNQANDGVPHLSFDIPHMEHGYYYFKAPHAGTYLYHCHVVSTIHVQGGMYGTIIIHPKDEINKTWSGVYDYDISMSLMTSEIDTVWHNDTIINHEHDTLAEVHFIELPRYAPQYYLINGLSDDQILEEDMSLNTSVGAVNYLRLINIGYKGNRIVFPPSFNAQIIDSDGRPLPDVEISDTLLIFPGERYGVLGIMPEEGLDFITYEYFDLNNLQIESTQLLPIYTEGFVSTDLINESEYYLSIHPNPFNNNFRLTVNASKGEVLTINILNIRGEIIDIITENQTIIENSTNIDYNNDGLNSGIYIVQVLIDGDIKLAKKLIKK